MSHSSLLHLLYMVNVVKVLKARLNVKLSYNHYEQTLSAYRNAGGMPVPLDDCDVGGAFLSV